MATPARLFGLTRILHPLFYIANMAMARSLVVLIGLICCLYMFGLATI
ncbi:TPA: MAPEG family protein [Vibrio parahaemolyticus]